MARLLLLTTALLASAVTMTATAGPRARALYGEVIAPCCWSQPVSVHQSPAADEVRTFIDRQVEDGRTDQQITDALVAEYGARVLARPPARGFTWTLYLAPWLVLVASGLSLGLLVRRFAGRAGPSATAAATGTAGRDDPLDERLDEELRDLD